MRVYYFTSEKYALSNIEHRHLKVSLIKDLNDPFELMGADVSDEEFRAAYEAGIAAVSKQFGLLCFTRDWCNPLMWAHYADKHRGICLGFDIDDHLLREINYVSGKLSVVVNMNSEKGELTEGFVEKILFTKHEDWRYEDEVRVYVPLEEIDYKTGFYFAPFAENMVLKEIIIGARSELTPARFVDSLAGTINGLRVFKTKITFDKFVVVEDFVIN